ncbi:MAG: hypothetical protein R3236_11050, partial [Phycisphaeraceae bacterium]|nr:hypothetical protein [Phycisphaeraceae bacterium]
QDAAQPFVWVVRGDQTVEKRQIQTGRSHTGGWVEVTSGLQPGDSVVSDKAAVLDEGQMIKPVHQNARNREDADGTD